MKRSERKREGREKEEERERGTEGQRERGRKNHSKSLRSAFKYLECLFFFFWIFSAEHLGKSHPAGKKPVFKLYLNSFILC